MAIRSPEARLPLEPEEYPLYKPPSRVGCSGMSIVALIAIASFIVLFLVVAPPIVRGITSIGAPSDDASNGSGGAISGAMQTQTAMPIEPSPTIGIVATPTPERKCVQVSGTGGDGVALREQPRTNARNVVPGNVGEGATFEIIGPDVPGGKDNEGNDIIWRHVTLPGDGRSGYVISRFVETEAPCP
jgi:hypothetical protein